MKEKDFNRMFGGDMKGEISEERPLDIKYDGKRERRETPLDLVETMRSFS